MNEPLKKTLYSGLQYGLKFELRSEIYTLSGLDNPFATVERISINGKKDKHRSMSMIYKDQDIKPILFSIDQLTKPITIGGDTFVPMEELYAYHNFSSMNWTHLKLDPTRYPFTIVDKLIEWHFNVWNLDNQSYIKAEEGKYY